jgi:hypothetical protein
MTRQFEEQDLGQVEPAQIKRITNCRTFGENSPTFYWVEWAHQPDSKGSWKMERFLKKCQQHIREYEQRQEPHPGNRIPGAWDQDEAGEPSYTGKERELTPEELDIHSLPASPKLERQNATLGTTSAYANDGQAMLVSAMPENAMYQIPLTDKYIRDSRNPKHRLISWKTCYANYCPHHYESKKEHDYFPEDKKKCVYQWYDCPKDTCHTHLFDKRTAKHFPNVTPEEDAASKLLVNGNCLSYTWQFCLHPDCTRHFLEKEANGYASFLGETDPRKVQKAATL